MARIIVLPEELEIIVHRLEEIEKTLKREQKNIEDPILTTEDVMNLLKISRRCLQNWRDKGIIDCSPINGKIFYRISAINKMLDKHLQKMED